MCKTKAVGEITEEMENALFLGAELLIMNQMRNTGQFKLNLNRYQLTSKLIQELMCVINEEKFEQLMPKKVLYRPKASLNTPGGRFKCLCKYCQEKRKTNLLSHVADTEIGLVKWIN